ncbi:hypothetical protein P5673_030939 [Acropora cervicornis]|uniref:Uncharacterized protein n=1 Tax=Acropora cervicornis TaxID=6130 RepID=A0AAD9UT89_ACRCE|nr:hypothetical protein P5673_030939 [Acropora cervicornis]
MEAFSNKHAPGLFAQLYKSILNDDMEKPSKKHMEDKTCHCYTISVAWQPDDIHFIHAKHHPKSSVTSTIWHMCTAVVDVQVNMRVVELEEDVTKYHSHVQVTMEDGTQSLQSKQNYRQALNHLLEFCPPLSEYLSKFQLPLTGDFPSWKYNKKLIADAIPNTGRMKVEEIKAQFAELFQILEETNPTQILPVYANAKQKPSSTPQTEEPSARDVPQFRCQEPENGVAVVNAYGSIIGGKEDHVDDSTMEEKQEESLHNTEILSKKDLEERIRGEHTDRK